MFNFQCSGAQEWKDKQRKRKWNLVLWIFKDICILILRRLINSLKGKSTWENLQGRDIPNFFFLISTFLVFKCNRNNPCGSWVLNTKRWAIPLPPELEFQFAFGSRHVNTELNFLFNYSRNVLFRYYIYMLVYSFWFIFIFKPDVFINVDAFYLHS